VFFQGRWCPFCMTHLQDLESHHDEFARVGANVVVVSIEDLGAAAQTQSDFPHLIVVSDQRRELSDAIDLINKRSAPDGGDSAAPTILLLDGQGTVQSLFRPTRFIARPSGAELVTTIDGQKAR
jgi:peroxiredoxin